MNSVVDTARFNGNVLVAKNGEIIYTKTIGFADVENNVKATENSKYRIGSISKSFTTVLILKAVGHTAHSLCTIPKFQKQGTPGRYLAIWN